MWKGLVYLEFMNQNKDYYQSLGLGKTATKDEIKKAYRSLAKQYHPDLNPEDREAESKFLEIQEAYEILSDDEKRKSYDMFGSVGFQPGSGYSRTTWNSQQGFSGFEFSFGDISGLDDLFGDIFGSTMGRSRTRPRRGRDSLVALEIDFETAIRGGTRDITISKETYGHKPERESISINLPAGIDNGQSIRVQGKGQTGYGGAPRGDLYLKIKIRPHPLFERRGDNIYLDLPVTVYEAVLGSEIKVPTIDQTTVSVKIPSGIQNGTKLRLKGKGVPNIRTNLRGDQYVIVNIMMPDKLDKKTKKMYEELLKSNGYNPRAKFDKYL